MTAESVCVGVRVRPFNDREKSMEAQLCVEMNDQQTILSKGGSDEQKFSFDKSFWSHDGFEPDEHGYCHPVPGSKYADQRYVYSCFGERILDNAWSGYHACLFAYGQTGSGKSYSMVGYGPNKGIIPIAFDEIFKRIKNNDDESCSHELVVSVIEIYNEAVQDLLMDPGHRNKRGLEIRESKMLGIYIDGVTKRGVASYADIETTLEEANQNRTVGATLMNATSSRAHLVLTIEFKQRQIVAGKEAVKLSMINLVDLAGSEKAGQTGATGDRLKEGSAINKSLSALGNVIEKLASKAGGKNPKVVIPYRDSKLTRLLQNALGGSSKTIMICAISPASVNYEESLSTLRYADRAKKIKNTAVVNENPQDKLVRELMEENAKLKEMMSKGSHEVDLAALEERKKEVERAEQHLQQMQMQQTNTGLERKKALDNEAAQRRSRVPFIANLNEDQQLVAKIKFDFPEDETVIVGCCSGPRIKFRHGIPFGTSVFSRKSVVVEDGGRKSVNNHHHHIHTHRKSSLESHTQHDGSGSESSHSHSDSESDSDHEHPHINIVGEGVYAVHCAVTNSNEHGCVLHAPANKQNKHLWGVREEHMFVNGYSIGQIKAQRIKNPEENGEEVSKIVEEYGEGAVVLKHGDRVTFGINIYFFVDPRNQRVTNPAELLIISGQVSFLLAMKELACAKWKNHKKDMSSLTTRAKLKAILQRKRPSEAVAPHHSDGESGKNSYQEQITSLLRTLEERDREIAELKEELQDQRTSHALSLGKVFTQLGMNGDAAKDTGDDDGAEVCADFGSAGASLRQALDLLNATRARLEDLSGFGGSPLRDSVYTPSAVMATVPEGPVTALKAVEAKEAVVDGQMQGSENIRV